MRAAIDRDSLPPHCPEAERGVLGCCLLDIRKADVALKAGVNHRWFYEGRHAELFSVLANMAQNGGGDCVLAAIVLREARKLESIGGIPYLIELQDCVPSAANLEYYIPELRDSFRRRQIIDAATRLKVLAEDTTVDSAGLLADTEALLEMVHRQSDANALPEIVLGKDFLASDIPTPGELMSGVLHQGSKLILGGCSKSYKTWSLIDLAVSVASGTPWLGFETIAGKVLYVNLEIQAAFFRRRLQEVVAAKEVQLDDRLAIWNLRGRATDYRVLIPKIRTRIKDEGHALVIIDPTYKLLGTADENSATDITALLNMVENLAVTTGAAVALAGHFSKGNASAKESIDRISGSGVFARDPDSLITFTRHEEEKAFTVEMTLRNLPPVDPFVVQWDWPLFKRADGLDPSRLKQVGGRPATYTGEMLLDALADQSLESGEWAALCREEYGISRAKFYQLRNGLKDAKKVEKSAVDGKWRQIRPESRNPYSD